MQDDTNMDEDEPLDLITKNVYELQKIIKYKKQKLQKDKPRRKDKVNADRKQEPARERETEKQQKEKEREQDRERSDVMVLEGHTSKVRHYFSIVEKGHYIACIWSGDSSARIWTIGDGPCNSTIRRRPPNVLVLKHLESQATQKNKDSEGTLLATGCYDGQARIWKRSDMEHETGCLLA
ncbi:hypothetical protein KY290_038407 [Solanum tuberosum]|uniref:Uncharacterized protein n=1 Tax=Solanum tuberosum TaxID=4113 RepID=A0ABQ7TYD2_SOLTU|nr:hypothetical protein KY290_038407 [Solanum tuberosum]